VVEEGGYAVGMLVVDGIIPGSAVDGLLQEGDVLVKVEGRVITHFLPLEELLDEHVSKKVQGQTLPTSP
jgi:S1-C subfamily serine protease